MKRSTLIILTLISFLFTFCENPPAGTIEKIETTIETDQKDVVFFPIKEPSIEVYKYYLNDGGHYIYVSKFKACPQVQTITWEQSRHHDHRTIGNIIIFENDSIQVILKKSRK